MARPLSGSASKAAIRRDEFLKEARRLFLHLGFAKTTMEDIGRACGVGKGAAYYYFPDGKKQVVEEVVREENKAFLARIEVAISEESDPVAQLHKLIEARASQIADYLQYTNTLAEIGEILARANELHHELYLQEAQQIRSILAKGVESGDFKEMNLDLMPIILLGALRSVEVQVMKMPELKAVIFQLFDLVMNGIRAAH